MYILGSMTGVSIFSTGKTYEGDPEYVVVKEKDNLYLCRMLLKSEYFSQFDVVSFLITEQDINNGLTSGRPCIILQHLKYMDEADIIVNSYQDIISNIYKSEGA